MENSLPRIRALTLFLSFSIEDDYSVFRSRLQNAMTVNSLLKSILESEGIVVENLKNSK